MSDTRTVAFLTNPEHGVWIFNATDNHGRLHRFELNFGQMLNLGADAAMFTRKYALARLIAGFTIVDPSGAA